MTPDPASDSPGGTSGPGHVRTVAWLVALGSVLVLAVGAFFALRDDGSAAAEEERGDTGDGWQGVALGEPAPRPDFTLTDTRGRAFDFQAETRGELTMLFFGYTHCPDICPIQMATLGAALERPEMPDPTVVFVTTDPERDTPERLRSWLDQFGTDFVGLTGTREEIAAAEAAAGVTPSIRPGESGQPAADGDEYEVGHAAHVLAYTPDDLNHLVYPSGVRREDWIADLPRMHEAFPADGAAGSRDGTGSGAGDEDGEAAGTPTDRDERAGAGQEGT